MEYKISRFIVFSEPTINEKFQIVYSTRTTQLLLLSVKIVNQLLNGDFSFDQTIFNQLVNSEMLVDKNEDELKTILTQNKKAVDNYKTLYFVLQPTAACQLGCDYCGQAHSKDQFSDHFYPRILQRLEGKLMLNPAYNKLEIGWFGSEPLMAFSQIQKITPKLIELAKKYDCDYYSKVVTNGLSLKKNIFVKLSKLGIKKIEVTLDGSAKYHDARRHTKSGEPTFDLIFNNLLSIFSMPDFEDYGIDITIRCNVDATNHVGVEELINLLAEHKLQEKISKFYVAPIHAWGNDAHKISLEKQTFADREIEWFMLLLEKGFKLGIIPSVRTKVVCMAVNKNSEIVDAFGNIFNCTETPYVPAYAQSDYLMGNIRYPDEMISPKKDQLINWHQDVLDEKFPCAKCEILPICGGACPKQWHEEISPCPSIKFNLNQRLLLHTKQVLLE